MNGSPGSLSAYSKAKRKSFIESQGPAPTDYSIKYEGIIPRQEVIPPFDTTTLRGKPQVSFGPSPDAYTPFLRDRHQHGSPLFRWKNRLPETNDFSCSDPVWSRIADPWTRKINEIALLQTMRPRVNFEKYVSNNVPSVYNPQDIRCFVVGIDGRMYPWKMNRVNKSPGPKYDTYQIYTSLTNIPKDIDFGRMSERKALFPPTLGAGPAKYIIRRNCIIGGGMFLGQSADDPNHSAPRLCDLQQKTLLKENSPSPTAHNLPDGLKFYSSYAVSAPFKSRTPLGVCAPKSGPGPAAHFLTPTIESELNLKTPITPGRITFPPDPNCLAPFETSAERWPPSAFELNETRPSPFDHTILSFTDEMKRNQLRHEAAIPNPKEGFLISSDARPSREAGRGDPGVGLIVPRKPSPPKKWRNLRPKKGLTYAYFGAPLKYPDSPGPIYDSNPGTAAVKAHKSWYDPRRKECRTGFGNSGIARSTQSYRIDKDVPGPANYHAKLACCRQKRFGKLASVGPRFLNSHSDSPGPVHKLHEKAESSIWRASHLGTKNAFLKGVGIVYPWAGGFIKKNLDQAGDAQRSIKREDDYEDILCPNKAAHRAKKEGKKIKKKLSC